MAQAVAQLVRVIVPLERPSEGERSSSSPETFGAIALSRPRNATSLAVTLIHELQHLKLSAVIDLVMLTRPDDGRRYYAPWRDDPRPVSGLLQGAYAYLGISGFGAGTAMSPRRSTNSGPMPSSSGAGRRRRW